MYGLNLWLALLDHLFKLIDHLMCCGQSQVWIDAHMQMQAQLPIN